MKEIRPTKKAAALMRRGSGLFDAEHGVALAALDDLQTVARQADQMRNVDHRKRIGATHLQPIARRQGS